MRVGAIDCGTNSIRLLIADSTTEVVDGVEKTVLKDVVREMRIVRLGQGVDATGWLAQEALDRTFAAAREYAQLLKEHGADSVRFVATSATRDAGNRQVFVDGIREILGIEPEVISGDEEAALSFAGAVRAVGYGDGDTLVFDLGGGSTEFVLGDESGVKASRSVNIGCVRLTERHMMSAPGPLTRRLPALRLILTRLSRWHVRLCPCRMRAAWWLWLVPQPLWLLPRWVWTVMTLKLLTLRASP